MNDDLFTVWMFYENGTYREVAPGGFGAKKAVENAKYLIDKKGDHLGDYHRVTIVLVSDDSTVFEWTKEKGIIFPPPPKNE